MATALCTNDDDKHLEIFCLIWLDASGAESRDTEQKLRSVINYLKKFQDVKQCQQYIEERSKNDRLVIIVSGQLGREIVPSIYKLRQVISIYVYCMNKKSNEQWSSKFAKVKAVVTELDELVSRITADHKILKKVEEPLSYSTFNTSGGGTSTKELNGEFVFTQVLIDCLLKLKSNETDKNELINICKDTYKGNDTELNNLREFRENYSSKKVLWWYSRESFFYKILNGSLRNQEIHMIFLFRSFILDIHHQLQLYQSKRSLKVYRSQLMSNDELKSLKERIGQFISINSFFSTSTDYEQANLFLRGSDDLERVLFEIDADPKMVTTKPFADISKHAEFTDEAEILFMLGSIFRLQSIKHNDKDDVWIIRMIFCNDDELDLKQVLMSMKQEMGDGETNLHILGKILWEMGKFELAEKYFIRLLNEIPPNDSLRVSLYKDLGKLASHRGDYDMSMKWRQKSLELEKQNQLSVNPVITKTNKPADDSVMTSLQHYMLNTNIQGAEQKNQIHIIDVTKWPPTEINPVECGDIIEFRTKGKHKYDIFQVYRDGDDYYRVDNGLGLYNISTRTPANEKRMLLSFELPQDQDQSEMYLYFCVIESSKSGIVSKTRKCPKEYCELNRLKIEKHVQKISLTDEEKNQKVYLRKGDTIELNWSSKHGTPYRIEEMKYCPISGGLYTVEQTSDRALSKGEYSKTFNEFGMSFLFRLTDTNQIYDITVCVIDEKNNIKHIEITDNYIRSNFISNEENIISIEQNDRIMFEWDTRREQTIVQIEPFHINEHQQRSIELRNPSKHFSWPYGLTNGGCMYHQFKETGLFCYKTANDQIGTIIVKPKTTIHKIDLFNDQLICKMNTKDFVQFNWKKKHSQEPILIKVDSNSTVVPDEPSHSTGTFHCSVHNCRKIEPFFHYHFHTCETFLINISQYGLYNFAYSDNPDKALISVIVEQAIETHDVICDEENMYQPHRKEINRFDQVLFVPSSSRRANRIYQTDKYGNRLESEQILFQPQQNSINYFMKQFSELGIYYFSTDIQNDDKRRPKQSATYPLTIIVLPEIHFHPKSIIKGKFDSEVIIITNKNDFVIWEFEKLISHDVIKLRSNVTFQELISCHDRAIPGRNRRCIAFNCKRLPSGASFFCNPDFERVTGSDKDRLISTIIIDPPFVQNCFVITNKQFLPNILYIAKNDTVSWILTDNEPPNHRIYIQSNTNDDQNIFSDRNIAEYTDGVYHLHTFNKPGEYIIKSDRFRDTATVIVYSDKKRQVQQPQITESIDHVSQFDKVVHFTLSNNRNGNISYTLDGSSPTRHDENVHIYNPNEGVHFRQPGLHVLRAYATEDQQISSFITTSRFVQLIF